MPYSDAYQQIGPPPVAATSEKVPIIAMTARGRKDFTKTRASLGFDGISMTVIAHMINIKKSRILWL